MVHYKFYFGEEEAEVLQRIALSSRANVKRRRIASAVSAGMAILCLAAAISFFRRGFPRGGVSMSLFAAFFFAVLFGGAKWFQRVVLRRAMKGMDRSLYSGEREYFFDSDGVQVVSELGTGKNHWRAFRCWGEIEHYLYLKRLDNQVVLIDREKLSAEECREMENLLAAVAREQ